ncbi:MAG: biopolymer transporter ExbD [Verrucomicrobiota bacterium]
MKLTRKFKFSPALISVIPLVNVLFLVVIFFAMSSRFVLQPGLAVTLPSSSFTLGPQHNAQLVSILSTPIPAIYHRNQKVTLAELGERLRDPEIKVRSLIIRADRTTPYDFIMQVMNQGLQHGFSIVLATNPKLQ